jgi:hypothetical protein
MAESILKNSWQAPQIPFQLTPGLAAYIQSVAANIQAATFGPAGLDREQAQEGHVLVTLLSFFLRTCPSDHLSAHLVPGPMDSGKLMKVSPLNSAAICLSGPLSPAYECCSSLLLCPCSSNALGSWARDAALFGPVAKIFLQIKFIFIMINVDQKKEKYMKMHKMNIIFSLHLPSGRKVCPKVEMMNRGASTGHEEGIKLSSNTWKERTKRNWV